MKTLWPSCLCIVFAVTQQSAAVIFVETGDPQRNSTPPGDNSGWQYEGNFSWSMGVPIGPYFFITATHVTGTPMVPVFPSFDFRGDTYLTIGRHDLAGTDLTVWEVDHSKAFPTWAPLSSGSTDIGATATLIGRGTQRGAGIFVGPELKGWSYGAGGQPPRWGRNVITSSFTDATYGEILVSDFDSPGIPHECQLSTGDSGGGVFVLENGLWRLAGINLAADLGPFRIGPTGSIFYGAIFDLGGLEFNDGSGFVAYAEQVANIPTKAYISRVSGSLTAIAAIPGMVSVTSLAQENFSAWQKLYFTPGQISTPASTGPLADFDADSISNLLEFALNLEPGFNVQTTMTPATGLGGLPHVRLENISGSDHLTIEFVRRSAASGSGLTYTPQFSSDLDDWQAVGSVTITAINPRWERVKVVDPETTTTESKRTARLKVVAD